MGELGDVSSTIPAFRFGGEEANLFLEDFFLLSPRAGFGLFVGTLGVCIGYEDGLVRDRCLLHRPYSNKHAHRREAGNRRSATRTVVTSSTNLSRHSMIKLAFIDRRTIIQLPRNHVLPPFLHTHHPREAFNPQRHSWLFVSLLRITWISKQRLKAFYVRSLFDRKEQVVYSIFASAR